MKESKWYCTTKGVYVNFVCVKLMQGLWFTSYKAQKEVKSKQKKQPSMYLCLLNSEAYEVVKKHRN